MRLRDDIQLRNIAGEYVIVDPGQQMVDMSKVFTMNDTAADIWNEFHDKTFTKQDVVTYLMNVYLVEEEQAATDTEALLKLFVEQGLIVK